MDLIITFGHIGPRYIDERYAGWFVIEGVVSAMQDEAKLREFYAILKGWGIT